ncbi:uncharacterized protein LOC143562706 [Bidens hawaiensis]|uniref:uncharacterized protein LOC143562706 n=1 Tax=Bidens hawaiensis TaxID=980011 RepID=UPI00404B62F0
MVLELVKFVNSDLTWSAVKKGHRTMRRPKRTESSGSEFEFKSGNKLHDSVVLDYEKSGVAILGQHFAEEVLDVPIKKRILRAQARSPQHEAIKLAEKAVLDPNDFSGIELLAAAACHSSGHVESPTVEEKSTPRVDSNPDDTKQDISPVDSNDSSVQNLFDNKNDEGVKSPAPSKAPRFHWDLNIVMDEWEEPCDTEKSDLKDVNNDGLQNEAIKSQVIETLGDQVSKSDVIDSFVNPATCENVTTSTASVSQETATKVESEDKQAVSEVVQDKLTSEDHLSDCCGSNVSQDKAKSGYESPVEDGELREAVIHIWEKEESEELECVDYESDNMYEDNSDAIESVTKENIDDHDHDHPQAVNDSVSVSVQNNNIQQVDKADSQPVMFTEKDSVSKRFPPEKKNMSCADRPTSTSTTLTSCIRRSRSERDFVQPSYHGGQWVDSFSRNKHGSGGYPRPKNEAMNYNPRGAYRKESYGIHNGPPPSRDVNRDRSRDGYNNPDPCYSERKVSSFGPNVNRGRSQKQSRSRSRSGSPIAWHFQKKRNVDTKPQSPDYKPVFRKPNETDTGLVSQCVSRRFDDRSVIRERRSSPVRNRAYQRYDVPGYVGKFKSNDHFAPRFPPNSNNYSSIRDERRRFRYDDDESFKG